MPARVLVVEDDCEMRRIIAEELRREGYEVTELADGNEFLDFVASQLLTGETEGAPADGIISDLRMPGFSGFEILGVAYALGWEIPIIVVTAFGDEREHAKAKRLGAAAIVDKPFDMADLRALVRKLLGPELQRF